ncbi:MULTISPECIES: DUF2235 domain-containing protein [unclassified Mesorhizobium]|uniref:DUF2235 domain-containing protein n=1 Tax=unclassified Mesorhizobium TaxID=325217 RepID=UPI0003CE1377|nr:DUF2235 domain-containing protein [Mesorhizobium sp. LSJC265A00]ESX08530.1 hypothetical protein X768_22565 [Mesorhizobium sp. LSJC265A00]
MKKNIVICCDGTGNEVAGYLSNVLKLFRIAKKNDEQIVYYNPGVGTIGLSSEWNNVLQNAKGVFGLATGYGLDDNIMDAYRFVCQRYEDGDSLFLFGFSRGSYTVRALAGLIHMAGLLRPEQLNVATYALTAYKRASEQNNLHLAWDFGRIMGTRHATIHFLGVWDTVASMIVPRRDRFYLPSLRTLPFTRNNPSVRCFRQAVAIDERRRMFRLNRWEPGQSYVPVPFADPPSDVPQDVLQMAFAGVHSDIGGGYPESESGLSKFPLAWLADEAISQGLLVNAAMYDHLVNGKALTSGKHAYVAPDATAELHNSLTWGWWILELLPKSVKWREWKRRSLFRLYLPWAEPRRLPDDLHIHPSVEERHDRLTSYRPVNICFPRNGAPPRPAAP